MPVCTKCKQEKEVDEMTKEPKRKNGLHSWCKVCRSNYTKRYYKKYYQDNKEHRDAMHKAYMKRIKEEKNK
jgi:hypothetical protein